MLQKGGGCTMLISCWLRRPAIDLLQQLSLYLCVCLCLLMFMLVMFFLHCVITPLTPMALRRGVCIEASLHIAHWWRQVQPINMVAPHLWYFKYRAMKAKRGLHGMQGRFVHSHQLQLCGHLKSFVCLLFEKPSLHPFVWNNNLGTPSIVFGAGREGGHPRPQQYLTRSRAYPPCHKFQTW